MTASRVGVKALLCAIGTVVVTASILGQSPPYVTNVRPEGPNLLRGTLVNPLAVPLTAWSIDAMIATGRARTTQTSDALLVPERFVPAKGSIEFEIVTDDVAHRNLVFAAAITADGMEVGDPKRALDLMTTRFNRAVALQAVIDFLRSTEPTSLGEKMYEQLKALVPPDQGQVLLDVRSKALSGPVSTWLATASDIQNKNQAGAARLGVLKQRLGEDK